MAERKLQGKRVAIIAADMVERVELVEPRRSAPTQRAPGPT